MQNCPQCGQTYDDGTALCTHCGKVISAQQEQTSPTPPQESQEQPQSPVSEESVMQQPVSSQGAPPPEGTAQEAAGTAEAVTGGPVSMEGEGALAEKKPVFCSSCGEKLPDAGRFCAFCGTPASGTVKTEGLIPVSPAYYTQQNPFPQDAVPAAQKGKRTGLVVAVVCVVVLCMAVAVFALYRSGNFFPGGAPNMAKERAIVYVQGEESLKYKNSSMAKAEAITQSFDSRATDKSALAYRTQVMSRDGRYLLYLNDFQESGYYASEKGDLYLRDLAVHIEAGKPTDKGQKLASDVTSDFYFSKDEKYVLYINTRGELYSWDFEGNSFKIDSDVSGILDWDEKQVLYYKGTEVSDYTSYVTNRDFYLAPLNKENRQERVKIDSDINDLWDWTDDFTKFIYTKTSRSAKEGRVSFDVYWYDITDEKSETLITDVDDVVDCSAREGTLLYLLTRTTSLTMNDILEDDMVKEDAEMKEPSLSDYPLAEQYYNSYDWMYDDEFDYAGMVKEQEAYDKARREYDAKVQRDSLREKVEEDIKLRTDYGVSLYDLYYLKDGDRNRIDTGIYQTSYAPETQIRGDVTEGFAYYIKVDLKSLTKMKMSDITDSWYMFTFDTEKYLQENLDRDLYFTFLDGNSNLLEHDEKQGVDGTTDMVVTDEVDGIYYLATPAGSGYNSGSLLYYVPLTDKKLGKPVLVEESTEDFYYEEKFMGKYYYTTASISGKGDLYTLRNGERDRLCYDVSTRVYTTVQGGGNSLLFYENYDSGRNMGELYIMNVEKTKIADDVYDYYYRSDDMIYLLRNYRSGKGDLYLYNGTDLELIDYDVTLVMEPWIYEEEAAS